MSAIVPIRRGCFAISTEVGVMAYGALVAVADDVCLLGFAFAERTITEDAVVPLSTTRRWRNDLIYWDKAMSWMDLASTFDARGAKVPVWTVHALVPNAVDVLPGVNDCT